MPSKPLLQRVHKVRNFTPFWLMRGFVGTGASEPAAESRSLSRRMSIAVGRTQPLGGVWSSVSFPCVPHRLQMPISGPRVMGRGTASIGVETSHPSNPRW